MLTPPLVEELALWFIDSIESFFGFVMDFGAYSRQLTVCTYDPVTNPQAPWTLGCLHLPPALAVMLGLLCLIIIPHFLTADTIEEIVEFELYDEKGELMGG
jgi:hypothetical protein